MTEKWLKAETIAKKVLITVILTGAALALFMLIPKLLVLLLPFVVAYVISLIASPLTHILEKIKLPAPLCAIVSILFVAAGLVGVSALIVNKVVSEVYDFSLNMPELYKSVTDTFSSLKIAAIDIFNLLPDEAIPYVTSAFDSLSSSLTTFSTAIVEAISSATFNFIGNIPTLLIGFVFSILASYFLIRDMRKVKNGLAHFLGEDITARLKEFQKYLSDAVFAYFKAQGILMSITFVEVFIGLSVLNVNYSFLFAIVIAIVDAIPVFGTGTILLPWALFALITGRYTLTIGLAVIYAVCLVVRQFLEPRILSAQIGMHPLLTLLSMYAGFRFIGIFGMILGPVVTLIVKNFAEKYHQKKLCEKTP